MISDQQITFRLVFCVLAFANTTILSSSVWSIRMPLFRNLGNNPRVYRDFFWWIMCVQLGQFLNLHQTDPCVSEEIWVNIALYFSCMKVLSVNRNGQSIGIMNCKQLQKHQLQPLHQRRLLNLFLNSSLNLSSTPPYSSTRLPSEERIWMIRSPRIRSWQLWGSRLDWRYERLDCIIWVKLEHGFRGYVY